MTGNPAIRTESAGACPLCAGPGDRFYSGRSDHWLGIPGSWGFSRCRDCGLFWLDPRPLKEDIPRCYQGERYHTHRVRPMDREALRNRARLGVIRYALGYRDLAGWQVPLSRLARLTLLLPCLGRRMKFRVGARMLEHVEGGRLLDIGCGNGKYLEIMGELGWRISGVDIDRVAAETAMGCLGIDIHVGSIDTAAFPPEHFDAVTMSHVLEHIAYPLSFLKDATGLLQPGGKIVLIVPNARSLGERLFGEDCLNMDPPRHLVMFDPKTLRRCVEDTGVLEIEQLRVLTRRSGDIYDQRRAVRKNGRFLTVGERAEAEGLGDIALKACFIAAEFLGNPLFGLGEEIECVAVKKMG